MVTLNYKDLPDVLKKLDQPPKSIYFEGKDLSEILSLPRLAVVGSRKPTNYGRAVTLKLVSELASHGVVIVSGLAFGIDSIAHQACLEAGGTTLAVLPASLDNIYPRSHQALAKQILIHNGSLLSEYSSNQPPLKHHFIARNRLIAALSEAVLITEAAGKSGSLHTANFVLNMGKPVLAVPGNITSPMSEGCNNLIKAGAVPVTKAEDILTALGWSLENTPKKLVYDSTEEKVILELINSGITEGSELLDKSQLNSQLFNQTLTLLEITGRVRPLGANRWAI